jgi:hypothetical protein
MNRKTITPEFLNEMISDSSDDPLSLVPPPLRHLIAGFLKSREEDLVLLENFYSHKDFDGVEMMGHRLKGTGHGYGFTIISKLGEELERAARIEDLEGIEDLLKKLNAVVESLTSILVKSNRH